jgi:hypothetical protein
LIINDVSSLDGACVDSAISIRNSIALRRIISPLEYWSVRSAMSNLNPADAVNESKMPFISSTCAPSTDERLIGLTRIWLIIELKINAINSGAGEPKLIKLN